ncbi:MAG TPA: YcaO-related McrA-glycine thioamidation protein [Methanophagales archaeon]|nr:YcaO-related McrA-glycine thioamidation protein [Methanophagales archaeon]
MKIRLKRTLKRYFFDTHRALTPAETLGEAEKLKEKVGITRMEDITALDKLNIPVYSASRPEAEEGAVSVYTGKGLTREQARVSVIMEAIERYSGELKARDKAKFLFESYDGGRGEKQKVDPASLILSRLSTIGPSSKLEWCEGYDLLREEEVLVPANAVFHPYVSNRGERLFRSDTNGIASGNNIEEAIFHGITEVIERDALSYVELKKNAGKQIEIDEGDGMIFELEERLESAGVIPHFWYIPSDTGFATVALALDNESKDASLLVYGAGTHSDPRIATIRAITEAAQSRVMQIESMRRDAMKATSARLMSYDAIKKRNRYWFEDKGNGKEEKVRLDELPKRATETIDGDIAVALDKLRRVVNRVIVVDVTREEIGVPVVRAIIPGFEVYARNPERVGSRYR